MYVHFDLKSENDSDSVCFLPNFKRLFHIEGTLLDILNFFLDTVSLGLL